MESNQEYKVTNDDDNIEVLMAESDEDDSSDDSDDDSTSEESDDPDDDNKSEESDDPGDVFDKSQILNPMEATSRNSHTEPQMSFEDKVNHLHQKYPSFPKVMIKRVLMREDVLEAMDKAIACLEEMKGVKAEGSRNPQEGVVNEICSEPYSLEDKVKFLKKEFKRFPPFLIRKVLNRPDINEDLQIAKVHLTEMSSHKGTTNVGPDPNQGSNKTRGAWSRSRARGRYTHGRRQCWQRDGTNQTQSLTNNMMNQSQSSSGSQSQSTNFRKQSQSSNVGNHSQSSNVENQSQANITGNQSQSSNVGNQSQSKNKRNRNRNLNQNKKPIMLTQQYQGGWVGPGNDYNLQHHRGRGYYRRGGGNQRGGNFQYGMYHQQYSVGPQLYGGFPSLMGGPHQSIMPHPVPHLPPNSRNEDFLQGFKQRNTRVEGFQEPDRQSCQVYMTTPSSDSQPVEPNTIVLCGLNENTTFDNIRNFVEARTQELVLDIALSDDQRNAIITLENLSDFNKAKQRVSERQLEGSNVSIERVPVSSSIIVTGLSPVTTRDGLDFYFSAKTHVDVSDIVIRENQAVVTFEDPKAISEVLKTGHTLDDVPLKVSKYYPFLHNVNAQQQSSNNDIAIAVDPNVMAFITGSSFNDQLNNSLQRLGFTLKHNPGDNIAYIIPKADKVVDREKGIEHMTSFIKRFTSFTVDVPKKHQEAAVAGIYELQQELSKEKVSLIECQNDVKVGCLAKDLKELKSKFKSKVQEIESSESRKTHQNQTIEVEEEKLAVLKKFTFIEDHLSNAKFPDLVVQIDENKGTISIVGPKKQFSEAKIKLYQYLAKITERQISLSKTVVEMLSSDEGMKQIANKLKESNINAVFCIDEGENT